MYYVYKYTAKETNIVKYVGIANIPERRIKEHFKFDSWSTSESFIIEYFKVSTRSEAEAWESHLISLYNTGKYYNKSKKNWGIIASFVKINIQWEILAEDSILIENIKPKKTLIGKTKQMQCGLFCTVILENTDGTILVKFENGIELITTESKFLRRRIRPLKPDEYDYRAASSRQRSLNLKNERLGEIRTMNCGLKAEIIEYINADDITVKFENGEVFSHKKYSSFKNGSCRPNSLKNLKPAMHEITRENVKISTENFVGNKKQMICGLLAEIIRCESDEDIDILFVETNEKLLRVTYNEFSHGLLSPIKKINKKAVNNKYSERLGEIQEMNCGLKAEIIEYNSYSDISVKFENGKIRQHITYKSFLKRCITPEGRIQGRNKLIANSKKIGEMREMKCGLVCFITKYTNAKDINISFQDGTIIEHTTYEMFKKGEIVYKQKKIS